MTLEMPVLTICADAKTTGWVLNIVGAGYESFTIERFPSPFMLQVGALIETAPEEIDPVEITFELELPTGEQSQYAVQVLWPPNRDLMPRRRWPVAFNITVPLTGPGVLSVRALHGTVELASTEVAIVARQ